MAAPFSARLTKNSSTSLRGMLSPGDDIRVMGATPIRFFKVKDFNLKGEKIISLVMIGAPI
jgi:hypothetical protein